MNIVFFSTTRRDVNKKSVCCFLNNTVQIMILELNT